MTVFRVIAAFVFLIVSSARAHDHSRPELAEWFKGLKSGKGMCCDGHDAVHLSDTDWVTQNKPNSHYRVQVPRTKEGFEAALKGEVVTETTWIDIPDDAVVDEPNKSGAPQVWPLYGYMGISIRCFMAGSLT